MFFSKDGASYFAADETGVAPVNTGAVAMMKTGDQWFGEVEAQYVTLFWPSTRFFLYTQKQGPNIHAQLVDTDGVILPVGAEQAGITVSAAETGINSIYWGTGWDKIQPKDVAFGRQGLLGHNCGSLEVYAALSNCNCPCIDRMIHWFHQH